MKNSMIKELYRILSKSDTEAKIELSDKEHPIFQAHFPSRPILPGFVHFEIVADLFDLEIESIKRAKFVHFVTPNQVLQYQKEGNKFRVICEEKEVANFTL